MYGLGALQIEVYIGDVSTHHPTNQPSIHTTNPKPSNPPHTQDLVKFRLFLPELVLRLRLAADFSPLVRIACYWLMACALLEIILFLAAATRVQWRRLRAKGLGDEAIWEQELLVWAFLLGWHELLSYLCVGRSVVCGVCIRMGSAVVGLTRVAIVIVATHHHDDLITHNHPSFCF